MEVNPWQWLIGGNLESFLIQGWGDLKVSWRDERYSRNSKTWDFRKSNFLIFNTCHCRDRRSLILSSWGHKRFTWKSLMSWISVIPGAISIHPSKLLEDLHVWMIWSELQSAYFNIVISAIRIG